VCFGRERAAIFEIEARREATQSVVRDRAFDLCEVRLSRREPRIGDAVVQLTIVR
jgi:hypothetical protein